MFRHFLQFDRSYLRFRDTDLNLLDGEKLLECGAIVAFELQVPIDIVEWNNATVEEVEWELENLGFDGAKVDPGFDYVDFCDVIEKELIRIGLHSLSGNKDYICIDTTSSGPNVVIYDNNYRMQISPVRLMRALRKIKDIVDRSAFWPYITHFVPKDWVSEFEKFVEKEEISEECLISLKDVKFVLKKYASLNTHARKGFLKWVEGDYLAMLELSKRI